MVPPSPKAVRIANSLAFGNGSSGLPLWLATLEGICEQGVVSEAVANIDDRRHTADVATGKVDAELLVPRCSRRFPVPSKNDSVLV